MELISKFKKAFAILATVALVSTNVPIAFAQTFNDVATDHWAFDYVEQLVDEGVFDVADNFRPGDALNRAELVKIVITAVDGLAGYEAPATPTFDDVAADAWFFDYVEAAVQLDIVAGYTDAKGNLTGKFGPSDTVNRAQATKILVNAFGVPTTLEPAAPFSDVPESAWFYEYVTTAYNQSILDGYDNGKFGPADPVTRAQVAKLTVNAQDPVERVAEGEEEAEEEAAEGEEEAEEEAAEGEEEAEEEVLSEGDLEVSLNDDTSHGVTLPRGASSVDLASFDFTAADDDVTCTNMVVTRGGVGQVADWAELFLYDGVERLTTGRTINNDTNIATFPLTFKVNAGETRTLRLVGRVAAAATANNQHYFYFASAADLTCNAQSVAGDFPVAGGTFTVGGVTVNSLTLAAGTVIAQPLIGAKDAEVASFRTTAGADNDIAVHNITLTQNGTLSSSRLTNCKLLRGTDLVATAEGFNDKERITFVLDTPYLIPEGQIKNWYVRCDIDGGRATDTLEIYMDETSDIVAIDQQYGHGAAITNNLTVALVTAVTLKGGKVTITDNGPSASQVASNVTNIHLLDFSITTDRDLTVRDMTVITTISNDGTAGGRPDIPATIVAAVGVTAAVLDASNYCIQTDADQAANFEPGDMLQFMEGSTAYYGRILTDNVDGGGGGTADACAATTDRNLYVASSSDLATVLTAAATVVEVNAYSYLKNLRVVDVDKEATLQGPLTLVSGGTSTGVANSQYRRQFTEDYELKASETRHLAVIVDTDQNMVPGYQVTALIDFDTTEAGANNTTGFIKDMSANENVVVGDIVGNELVGKPMTIAQNSLAMSLSASPNPTNTTFIKGQLGVEALGVNFTAGDAGPITLKKLTFHFIADDDDTPTYGANDIGADGSQGDIEAKTVVASAAVYEGTTLLAEPEGLVINDGGTYVATNDNDKAEFDNLNIVIPAGTTKTLIVRVNLQSSVPTITAALDHHALAYITAGTADVTAEDKDANVITPTGGIINDLTTTSVAPRMVRIELSGTLTIRENSSPQPSLKVAGASKQLVSQYQFSASREAWDVQEVNVLNVLGAGDFNGAAADTSLVRDVWIEYPDVNGVTQTLNQGLSTGAANFSLKVPMHVSTSSPAILKIYADIQTSGFGQSLSGQSFRLGMDSANGNDATGTFRAVGAASGESFYNAVPTGFANVHEHIVRFTVPTIAKDGADEGLGTGGLKDLYKVKITADPARSIEVKRIVFRVSSVFTAAADDLFAFRIHKGTQELASTAVAIVGRRVIDEVDTPGGVAADDDAVDLYASSSNANGFDLIDADGTSNDHYVVVDFVTAESILGGASQVYTLKANVSGASVSGEAVSAYIPDDATNVRSGGAGTLAKFPGCYSLIEPDVGAADDAYVLTDLDCDGTDDGATEFRLNVAGVGNGTTGLTAETVNFGAATQSNRTLTTDGGGVVAGTILRGQLAVMDPNTGVDDDHFFWFDEDADGNMDTTEVVLSDAPTAGDVTALNASAAPGLQTAVALAGTAAYAYVTMASPFLYFDNAAGADQAGIILEDDITNANATLDAGELMIDVLGDAADETALDQITVGSGLLNHFVWSDTSVDNPSHSENSTDWTNGFLVNSLSTTAKNMAY